MSQKVLLFDIDGVLVEPHGYRMTTRTVLKRYTDRMGIDEQYQGDPMMDYFESRNITSEWDITGLCLAAILDAACAAVPGLDLPADLDAACDRIREAGAGLSLLDFTPVADRLGRPSGPAGTVSEQAYRMSLPGVGDPLYPHLAGHPLLELLLERSRDLCASPVTRLFQQYALGSETFERLYRLPAELVTESYLGCYDIPLLEPELRTRLLDGWRSGALHLAVYTARSSGARGAASLHGLALAPEAEMVLELVGLDGVPLVGGGQVERLSRETGQPASRFMKPSPVQALGAIGAALTRDEISSLIDAARWVADPGAPGLFAELPPLEIAVFEDSPGSIRAVKRAGEMLSAAGVPNRVRAYGISRSPVKLAALQEAGAALLPDINQALRRVLAEA